MVIKPVGKRVVVKVIKEDEEKTKSGLILTTGGDAQPKGVVDEVGDTSEVVVGDKILFKKDSGYFVSEEKRIVDVEDILGIINDSSF